MRAIPANETRDLLSPFPLPRRALVEILPIHIKPRPQIFAIAIGVATN